ncbi:MAG: 50S ribosomal protein L25 [Lutisporaceae bacterium]
MEEIILEAIVRTKQPGKFRESGFVPGVLYGDSVSEATLVKFDTIALTKILTRHGANAKVWIKYDNNKKFGFIKEVQKHPVSGIVTHIDVHIVSKDHEVKLQIPIIFKGEDNLKNIQLQLQVYKSEINVLGKMALMPDAIYVDVSTKKLGDTITLKDFDFDKQINVSEKEDEIYGMITNLKNQPTDETVETKTE